MTKSATAQWTTVPAQLNRATAYHVQSAVIQDTLEVVVVDPLFPVPQGAQLPIVVVLDPIACLDVVVGISRIFDIFSRGAIPLKYVVGVGYPSLDVQARRFRDLTPTPAQLPAGIVTDVSLGTGGAGRFLEALAEEIIPGIELRHNANADRTLIGYSLSARFALYALFTRPNLFKRYLVASPSFWWDKASIFDEEAAYAAAHRDLAASVFLSIGAGEEELGGEETDWRSDLLDQNTLRVLQQQSHHNRFIETLARRQYPSLKLVTAYFPEERHITVFPAAAARGLAALLKT